MDWPKAITVWQEGDIGHMSVPFTWLLPEARGRLLQTDAFIGEWLVGGPAVRLMPKYLEGLPKVTIGHNSEGALQRVNPIATRTTVGCPNRCAFCAVPTIEGPLRELEEWPDLPVLCDNNLLAASDRHLDKVFSRLSGHEWCDFNQGLDIHRMNKRHAQMITSLSKPMCRLALDHDHDKSTWRVAVELLLEAGLPKSRIRTYVLVGYEGGVRDDWLRCEYVDSFGLKPLPMWYHTLECLCYGMVTKAQWKRGWTVEAMRRLMQWFYKHRGSKPIFDQDGDVDRADLGRMQIAWTGPR